MGRLDINGEVDFSSCQSGKADAGRQIHIPVNMYTCDGVPRLGMDPQNLYRENGYISSSVSPIGRAFYLLLRKLSLSSGEPTMTGLYAKIKADVFLLNRQESRL